MLKAWKRKEGANGRYKSYGNTDIQYLFIRYKVHIHIYMYVFIRRYNGKSESETELDKRIIVGWVCMKIVRYGK